MDRAKPPLRSRSRMHSCSFVARVAIVVSLTAGATQAGPVAAPTRGPVFTQAAAFDVSPPLTELAAAAGAGKSPPLDSPFDADRDMSLVAVRKPRRAGQARPAVVATPPPPPRKQPLLRNSGPERQLRGSEQPGQLQRARLPRQPARPGRRRRARTTTWRWSTSSSPSTPRPARCCSARSTRARCGPGSRSTTAPTPRATRSCVYDQFADRWILTQFTTRGLRTDAAVLQLRRHLTTGDPTGAYYRYAFTTGFNFPDYPKYGVWTTRT